MSPKKCTEVKKLYDELIDLKKEMDMLRSAKNTKRIEFVKQGNRLAKIILNKIAEIEDHDPTGVRARSLEILDRIDQYRNMTPEMQKQIPDDEYLRMFEELCDCLQSRHNTIVRLDLSDCRDFYDGLLDVFYSPNNKIEILILRNNNVRGLDVSGIISVLERPACKLVEIDLSENELSNSSLTKFVEYFRTTKSKLKRLDLRGNKKSLLAFTDKSKDELKKVAGNCEIIF